MSQVLMSETHGRSVFAFALSFLKKSLFGRAEYAGGHAHPWSAFRAETYLAGAAPAGVVMATRVGPALAPKPAAVSAEDGPAPAVAEQAIDTAIKADAAEKAAPTAPTAVTPPVKQPVTAPRISLVPAASTPPNKAAVSMPGIAAHKGVNFQLAARLHSVAVLNRKMTEAETSTRIGSFAPTNRPKQVIVKPVRTAQIAPPAVRRRKTRKMAEIIHLNVVLDRVTRRAKARAAA